MKICYVVGHFYPHVGGVENLFMLYAKGAQEAGNEVRVVTSGTGGITGYQIHNNVPTYHYPWKVLSGHPIPKKSDLREHIEWADIVHTTTFLIAPPTLAMCKRYNKKVLITVHEVIGDKWRWIEKNPLKVYLYKMVERYTICRNYDVHHVISLATERDFREQFGNKYKTAMIYNCINEEEIRLLEYKSRFNGRSYFEIEDSKKKLFLYFGRPGKSKGIFVYLDAIKKLKERNEENFLNEYKFGFILSNDPIDQKNEFLQKINSYGLENVIIVKNPVKRGELFRCIKNADYVVVPSITEGFGYSAVETCVLGTPIIYSDGGSLPEVVFGKTLSFENRNSTDLSNQLESVIKRGNEVFVDREPKEFSVEILNKKMELLYRELQKGKV